MTHPAFDSPDADVVLVSRDLVRFQMHSFTLKTTSGWFRSLFSMPRPSPSSSAAPTGDDRDRQPALSPSTTDPETIHLDEDSSTLELLFRLISGLPIQPLTSFDTVDALLFASEKYDMPGPMSLVRIAVLTPPLADQPLRLYAAASRCGWTEEAKVASQRTLAMNLWQDDNWEMLAKVDVRSALALLKLHRSRREDLRKKLDEHPFVSANPVSFCSRCRRMTDHRGWRELKHRLVAEMDARPLGDTILDVGLTEWPEAKACWEAKCPHVDCAIVQYDKTETMRLIKECIDSLSKTT
ncbi:hypothetical protein EV363DRAFT_1352974 [Boletus edulis]|uniref:BTB domain-containing protein n=1 Tax=Boletus edulis BED1 TaxID=1328754 RepID=A0AAD4BWE0_BOLED|nr:hypothetical protein EV363DRAFT_1352974 [Boletus edulis]KAF8441758.1 hypothetical protein L210DRAFT_3538188 [Boletus edulis BED1]